MLQRIELIKTLRDTPGSHTLAEIENWIDEAKRIVETEVQDAAKAAGRFCAAPVYVTVTSWINPLTARDRLSERKNLGLKLQHWSVKNGPVVEHELVCTLWMDTGY